MDETEDDDDVHPLGRRRNPIQTIDKLDPLSSSRETTTSPTTNANSPPPRLTPTINFPENLLLRVARSPTVSSSPSKFGNSTEIAVLEALHAKLALDSLDVERQLTVVGEMLLRFSATRAEDGLTFFHMWERVVDALVSFRDAYFASTRTPLLDENLHFCIVSAKTLLVRLYLKVAFFPHWYPSPFQPPPLDFELETLDEMWSHAAAVGNSRRHREAYAAFIATHPLCEDGLRRAILVSLLENTETRRKASDDWVVSRACAARLVASCAISSPSQTEVEDFHTKILAQCMKTGDLMTVNAIVECLPPEFVLARFEELMNGSSSSQAKPRERLALTILEKVLDMGELVGIETLRLIEARTTEFAGSLTLPARLALLAAYCRVVSRGDDDAQDWYDDDVVIETVGRLFPPEYVLFPATPTRLATSTMTLLFGDPNIGDDDDDAHPEDTNHLMRKAVTSLYRRCFCVSSQSSRRQFWNHPLATEHDSLLRCLHDALEIRDRIKLTSFMLSHYLITARGEKMRNPSPLALFFAQSLHDCLDDDFEAEASRLGVVLEFINTHVALLMAQTNTTFDEKLAALVSIRGHFHKIPSLPEILVNCGCRMMAALQENDVMTFPKSFTQCVAFCDATRVSISSPLARVAALCECARICSRKTSGGENYAIMFASSCVEFTIVSVLLPSGKGSREGGETMTLAVNCLLECLNSRSELGEAGDSRRQDNEREEFASRLLTALLPRLLKAAEIDPPSSVPFFALLRTLISRRPVELRRFMRNHMERLRLVLTDKSLPALEDDLRDDLYSLLSASRSANA